MKTLSAALFLVLFGLAPTIGAEKLRIGVDPDYPPFSEIDEQGRLKGFDIDITLALCARMDTTCSFVRQDWEGLVPGLRAGKFDAIVSSMSITGKRRRLVAFTDRYYSNLVRFGPGRARVSIRPRQGGEPSARCARRSPRTGWKRICRRLPP